MNALRKRASVIISIKTGSCLPGSWSTIDLHGIKFVCTKVPEILYVAATVLLTKKAVPCYWAMVSAEILDKSSEQRIPGHVYRFIQEWSSLKNKSTTRRTAKARVSNYHLCAKMDFHWPTAQLGAKNCNALRKIAPKGSGPQVLAPRKFQTSFQPQRQDVTDEHHLISPVVDFSQDLIYF